MIISKCPLRISLIGGSTDLQGFIDKFGKGSVISFPSNLYTYITINKNITDSNYKINYSTSEKTLNPKTIKYSRFSNHDLSWLFISLTS